MTPMSRHRLDPICRAQPRCGASGAAIIELALVATALLTLLLGIIEIGRGIAQYNLLVDQVETAARYLATRPPGSGSDDARCLVVYGTIAAGCPATAPAGLQPVLAGLTASMVSVTDGSTSDALLRACSGTCSSDTLDAPGVRMNLVQVSVSGYPFSVVTGEIGGLLFGPNSASFTFPTISSTQRQFGGWVAP